MHRSLTSDINKILQEHFYLPQPTVRPCAAATNHKILNPTWSDPNPNITGLILSEPWALLTKPQCGLNKLSIQPGMRGRPMDHIIGGFVVVFFFSQYAPLLQQSLLYCYAHAWMLLKGTPTLPYTKGVCTPCVKVTWYVEKTLAVYFPGSLWTLQYYDVDGRKTTFIWLILELGSPSGGVCVLKTLYKHCNGSPHLCAVNSNTIPGSCC